MMLINDVNLLNSQAHFYKPYGHFVTKRQTALIVIYAASEIPVKCVLFVNRLRI